MGTRIQDATLISQLTAELEFAVGNTGDDTTASAVRLSGIKQFVDSDKSTVAITGSYTDLSDKPNLNEYVQVSTLNSNFYNKSEVDNLIGDISGISFEIVQNLPAAGSPSVIYLVYNDEYDRYDEWIYTNDEWVNIGNTNIDLSNYYTRSQTDALIPTVNNSTITIQQNGVTAGTFTLNQSSDATISLTGGGGGCDCPQADWDESDPESPSFIENKPVIPTVNNPEILFCVNGDVIDSITLNQSNSKAIDFESFTQVQSDWNQSDDTLPSFIKNKPSIPQVNNPTIHFTQGGVDKGSITLNQSSGATIALDAGGGGGAGVQSNWNEADTSSLAYIQNKPTISDATISVCIDGDVVDSFTLNQSSSHTIDLSGATQVQSDWDEADTSSMAYILNKPTIPDAVSGTNDGTNWTTLTIGSTTKAIPSGGGVAQVQSDWSQSDNTQVDYIKNKPSLATVATSGSYADLSNTPTISDATISVCIDGDVVDSFTLNQSSAKTIDLGSAVQVQSDWDEADSSSMAYILNKPTIPAAQVNSDWNSSSGVSQILNKPSLATVATSGSYADLSNKPTIPSNTRTLVVTYEDTTTENITVYTT